jgi:hypothetical protein
LPLVLGLLAVLAAVMGVVGLISLAVTDSSERPWWASPCLLITETVLMGAFGGMMLVLYNRFREEVRRSQSHGSLQRGLERFGS